MSQDFLDMPYVDIGFQQMGCINMTKNMRMNMFFKTETFQSALQNPDRTRVLVKKCWMPE